MRNYCQHCSGGKVWIGGGIVDVFDWALYGLIRWKWPSLYAKCSECNGTGMQRPPLYSWRAFPVPEVDVRFLCDEPPKSLAINAQPFPGVPEDWECINMSGMQANEHEWDVTATFRKAPPCNS